MSVRRRIGTAVVHSGSSTVRASGGDSGSNIELVYHSVGRSQAYRRDHLVGRSQAYQRDHLVGRSQAYQRDRSVRLAPTTRIRL